MARDVRREALVVLRRETTKTFGVEKEERAFMANGRILSKSGWSSTEKNAPGRWRQILCRWWAIGTSPPRDRDACRAMARVSYIYVKLWRAGYREEGEVRSGT